MTYKSRMRIAVTAAAIACATAASAQQTDTAAFGQEVVVSNAVRYARFTGELVQVNRDGSVRFEEPLEPVRLAAATPAAAPVLPARLPDTAGWTPLLVVFGVLALIGGFLLMTRRHLRRAPWESEETEASTAYGREKQLADELKVLWDKTTTTETLRPRDEAQPPHLEPKP